MKISFTLLFLCLIMTKLSFGQDLYKEFKLIQPDTVISNSLYNSIEFIDSRVDTKKMGIVQIGLMNNPAKVITEIPLSEQLNEMITKVVDSTASDGKLLLQIRHLLFAEKTNMTSEYGYCYLTSNLYAKRNNNYEKIVSIDTSIVVKRMDVTNLLLKSGSKLITDLIVNNLKTTPYANTQISYNNIAKVDSIEKSKIKIYNVNLLEDGLYYSYNSFKNQIPDDKDFSVKIKQDLSVAYVKTKSSDQKWTKINGSDVYAFVYEGKPYISTGYGYYPIYKNNKDYYFIGRVKPNTKNNDGVAPAAAMFGIIGGIIAANSGGSGVNYFNIIDHNTGNFIQARKMPTH